MRKKPVAIVAGLGPGLGAALSRKLIAAGYRVVGVSRSLAVTERLEQELNAQERVFSGERCDVRDTKALIRTVSTIERDIGRISVYVHNAAQLILKPFLETSPDQFESLWRVILLGAVNGAQAVLPSMRQHGGGCLLFIGATASMRGGPNSAAFSSAKFALRGLAQSLARAYGPSGIHVCHLVVDGVIWGERESARLHLSKDQCLAPQAVAESCQHVIEQHPSAWTMELDVRPSVEKF